MKIIFNTKSLLKQNQQGNYFLQETLKRIIINYPEHEFFIMTEEPGNNTFFESGNVTPIITNQSSFHPLLKKLWCDLKLPAILKKYKPDVFVSCDGFCSLTTRIPQCLLLHDLTFFYNPSVIKRSYLFFFKRWLPAFFHKAAAIITVSASVKKELALQYKIQEDKIDVVYTASQEIFIPVDEKEREEIKGKYSDGKNYFIAAGTRSNKNLMTLLKAFSIFKKRQKSNWKLLITGSTQKESKVFHESLNTYKYRDDIVLTGFLKEEEMVKLTGSAYALIYQVQWDGIAIGMLEAMNCHIPVIASENSVVKEIAGDAVLYAGFGDHLEIADKMMLLYKDETLRHNLVEKGKIVGAGYTREKTSGLLWQSIQKAYATSASTQK